METTYLDGADVERCDDCDEQVDDCDCACYGCGESVHECECDEG